MTQKQIDRINHGRLKISSNVVLKVYDGYYRVIKAIEIPLKDCAQMFGVDIAGMPAALEIEVMLDRHKVLAYLAQDR